MSEFFDCKSTCFTSFCQAFDFAFTLQSVCKMFAYHLSADGKDEFIPLPSSALAAEHFFVEAATHGANGTCIAGQYNGNIRRSNPEFDKQAYLIFQLRHCVKVSQLTTVAWIYFLNLALYDIPVIILQYHPRGDAALQGLIFVGSEVGSLHRLNGLPDHLRTFLLYLLNLLELQLQSAFVFTIVECNSGYEQ